LNRCRWFPRQRFSPLLRTLLARNIHLLRALFVWLSAYAALTYLNLSNMLAAALLIAGDEQMHSGEGFTRAAGRHRSAGELPHTELANRAYDPVKVGKRTRVKQMLTDKCCGTFCCIRTFSECVGIAA
jgi:hypothetical protein